MLPSLILFTAVLLPTWRLWFGSLRIYVLSGAFVAYRTISDLLSLGTSPASARLELGGSPAHNLWYYAGFLVNQYGPSHLALAAITVVAITAVVALAVIQRRGGIQHSPAARTLLWATTSVIGSLAINLFTNSPAPYLLLLTAVFAYVGLAALVSLLGKRLGAVGDASMVWLLVASLVAVYPLYDGILARSHNFGASLPTIRRAIPADTPKTIYFVLPTSAWDAYQYVGEPNERDIAQFIYGSDTPNRSLESRMVNIEQGQSETAPGIYVTFLPTLSVGSIVSRS